MLRASASEQAQAHERAMRESQEEHRRVLLGLELRMEASQLIHRVQSQHDGENYRLDTQAREESSSTLSNSNTRTGEKFSSRPVLIPVRTMHHLWHWTKKGIMKKKKATKVDVDVWVMIQDDDHSYTKFPVLFAVAVMVVGGCDRVQCPNCGCNSASVRCACQVPRRKTKLEMQDTTSRFHFPMSIAAFGIT